MMKLGDMVPASPEKLGSFFEDFFSRPGLPLWSSMGSPMKFYSGFERGKDKWPEWPLEWRGEMSLGPPFPAVDVEETQQAFEMSVDLPGMDPKEVKVAIEGNVLTLSGERSYEKRSGDRRSDREEGTKSELNAGKTHRIERRYGAFQRMFTLPQGIDHEHIAAQFDNGVLKLTLPKREIAKTKQIPIEKKGAQAH